MLRGRKSGSWNGSGWEGVPLIDRVDLRKAAEIHGRFRDGLESILLIKSPERILLHHQHTDVPVLRPGVFKHARQQSRSEALPKTAWFHVERIELRFGGDGGKPWRTVGGKAGKTGVAVRDEIHRARRHDPGVPPDLMFRGHRLQKFGRQEIAIQLTP